MRHCFRLSFLAAMQKDGEAENMKYVIITNNPLVAEKTEPEGEIVYLEVSYDGLLKAVRDRVYKGCPLLTHPLAGSVKPGETPYRSVIVSAEGGELDIRSVELIENAISYYRKFTDRTGEYPPSVLRDFQLIDLALLESALEAADGRQPGV